MNRSVRMFVPLSVALGLLVPGAWAQKPPASAPPPPAPPSHVGAPISPDSQPVQPRDERPVLFLIGRVATSDGTHIPSNVLVERICNTRVRQQVYASYQGDFRMDLGSMTNALLDASADGPSRVTSQVGQTGIPRHELATCDLRAVSAGFRSSVVSLISLEAFNGTMEVGDIVVERSTKIRGTTLSAVPYQAPKAARKAYEEGLQAKGKGEFSPARQYFEKAVDLYPRYVHAWFQLGNVLEQQKQKEAARTAYTRATAIDTQFLPPYLSLASLACEAENWTEVLHLTAHVLDLDPLNYSHVSGYILDLDPFDYAGAYYYHALANYKLNNIDAAEKSALKAATLDVRPRLPRLHLLLAEIFARKNNYASAASEIRTYLELAPQAPDADHARARLAELEKLGGPVSRQEKPSKEYRG